MSLGSNQGDRLAYLRAAVLSLQTSGSVQSLRTSSVYETAPVGLTDQAPFLNMVVACQTALTPLELLRLCQTIEAKSGRTRTIRWGPRTLDIDIVAMEGVVQNSEELTLPHPRAHERAFVLVPLLELEPNAELGSLPVRKLLERIGEEQSVTKYSEI